MDSGQPAPPMRMPCGDESSGDGGMSQRSIQRAGDVIAVQGQGPAEADTQVHLSICSIRYPAVVLLGVLHFRGWVRNLHRCATNACAC